MSAFLIAIPDLKGGKSIHLYRDEMPIWWGKKHAIPGAILPRKLSDEDVERKSLDELMAYARQANEYEVAA